MPTGTPRAAIAIRVPLPGSAIINASNDVEYLSPILEGDRLNVVEELASLSPEQQTRLGAGHFVETLETCYRADGTALAASQNTSFRYAPAAPS